MVANFLVVFLVQMAFQLNDIINTGRYPTVFEVVMVASNSLVTTLIFYGFNRMRKETVT